MTERCLCAYSYIHSVSYAHIPHAYTCAQVYDRGGYHVPALLTHGAGASLHTLGKRGGQMPSLYVWQAHGDVRGALEQGPFVCVNIYVRTSALCGADASCHACRRYAPHA